MLLHPKNRLTVYLIGDSTMADYANNYEPGKDYMKVRYPVTGWDRFSSNSLSSDSLHKVKKIIKADSVFVDDRAARRQRVPEPFFKKGVGGLFMKI